MLQPVLKCPCHPQPRLMASTFLTQPTPLGSATAYRRSIMEFATRNQTVSTLLSDSGCCNRFSTQVFSLAYYLYRAVKGGAVFLLNQLYSFLTATTYLSAVSSTTIAEIQGNRFRSPFAGQFVTQVSGVVTAKVIYATDPHCLNLICL